MKKAFRWAANLYFILMMVFLYLPIFYIIIFSFNDSRSLTKLNGFSLRWYERLFSDSTMLEAAFYTLMLAVLATLIATVVATITSIGLTKSKRYVKIYIENLNNYPIMSPDIVLAIGLLVFFSTLALKKGFLTLLLAHTMICIPYVMLSIMPKLNAMNPNLIDAALDLGATPMQALRKVIVPEIRPGIISGALISFTMSFDDFVVSYFVTGNGVNTIPIMIYSMAKRVNPSVNALSTLIILIFILALFIMAFYQLRKKKRGGDTAYRALPASLKIALTGILFVGIAAGLLYMRTLGSNNAPVNEAYTSSVLKVYTPG
ncbi:MAG: ABC transporter permease, partial [Lachnospiraceae bacterium]|nr:ABC transporter permease [Lachnospiraceae bacterium]